MKKALVSGITGQDASYLAELLLSKGYETHGIVRRASTFNRQRIEHLHSYEGKNGLVLHYGDMTDSSNLIRIIKEIEPDEIYHLAAMSVTGESLCPIKSADGIKYRTLKNLWAEQVRKHKEIKTEKVGEDRVEFINLPKNTQLNALGMWNGMGTWFPIKQIIRHRYKGKVVKMSQKFGVITVTPNHSVLDVNQKVCKPQDNPWLLCVRKLNYNPTPCKKRIKLMPYGVHRKDDKYFWFDEKGRKGKVLKYIQRRSLESFCRFVGAFVSEGHTHHNKVTGAYQIGISNSNKQWLEGLEIDLKRFFKGNVCYIRHKEKKEGYKVVWELSIKSRALYNTLRHLCGVSSSTKKLPHWFPQIEKKYLKQIWIKLREGDGCYYKKSDTWKYCTTSYKLSCQLGWLFTVLGHDYTVHEVNYPNNKKWHTAWNFALCKSYQRNQGDKKIELIDYDGYVYDLSVDGVNNFAVGIGNVVVHNSHVQISFDIPEYTADVDAIGTLRLLNAVKFLGLEKKTRILNAATSELFGGSEKPANEKTPFNPKSPYAVAKLYSYYICKIYRDAYGMFVSNSIAFNHESSRRSENFVTRKITLSIANIMKGKQEKIYLGNLDAKRDWGYAKDYVEIQWKMLQQDKPDDFVIATGETHSIREFVELAFKEVGIDIVWKGKNLNEKGINSKTGKILVEVSPKYFRPLDVNTLIGDSTKARNVLGWYPKTRFKELVKIMVKTDVDNVE